MNFLMIFEFFCFGDGDSLEKRKIGQSIVNPK